MSPAPSSAQLEVVRRLAPAASRLEEIVLTTPVGGRGAVDDGSSAQGPPSERELLRVCVAALTRFCELDPDRPARPRRRLRPVRRSKGSAPVVVGTSPQARALRECCAGVRVPGPAVVLVVGGALDAAAAGLWRQRVEEGAGLRWRRMWEAFVARGRLPSALDPVRQAERWRERTAPGRLHLLLAGPGQDLPDLEALLSLGLPSASSDRLDAVDTDLLRRLNQSLATRPEVVRRRPYDGPLSARFDRPWTGEPGVPEPFLAWAVEQGRRVADAVAASGLPVHGDPACVVPSIGARERIVPVGRTLERALEVLRTQFEGGDPWRAR